MLIQILIPHYLETEEEISCLLNSIALQQRFDLSKLGVIIVNDGQEKIFSKEFLSSWPFQVEYYINEKRGVSAARNLALKKSIADYIMFCDADDIFHNMFGLFLVEQELLTTKPNILFSAFVEEQRQNESFSYRLRDKDVTFVHGKFYNRNYLISNNIEWKEELTIFEDSYFNGLAFELTDKISYCPTAFYTWKWRDGSVTRSSAFFLNQHLDCLIDAHQLLIRELQMKKRSGASFHTFSLLFSIFLILEHKHNLQYLPNNFFNKVSSFFEEFKDLYNLLTEEEKLKFSRNFIHLSPEPENKLFFFEKWLGAFRRKNE